MNREVLTSLAWGIGIVVLALCATFARSRGYIDSEMVDRIVMGAVGLMLSGLVYAGFWIAAPKDVAVIGGSVAVLLGIAITALYCLSLRNKTHASGA
jgi:hypothetical protein